MTEKDERLSGRSSFSPILIEDERGKNGDV